MDKLWKYNIEIALQDKSSKTVVVVENHEIHENFIKILGYMYCATDYNNYLAHLLQLMDWPLP